MHFRPAATIFLAFLTLISTASSTAISPISVDKNTAFLFENTSSNPIRIRGDGGCNPGERMCMAINKNWTMHVCNVKGKWKYMTTCGTGAKCCDKGDNGLLYCAC